MEPRDVDRAMEIAAGLSEAPQWSRAAWERVTAGEIAGEAPRRVALVAERNASIVGFAVATMVVGEAELESIAVESSAQRLGIGRGLLRNLIGELKRRGAGEMLLEVRASNQAALHIYRGMGFVETGRRAGYYAQPVEDAVLMRLDMSSGTFDERQGGFSTIPLRSPNPCA